ncbi:MAG: hypothetical protein QOI68_2359, partial [Pseudonocardiales bacterium]|nr:hypothetical protein [Pseudonocardiales bacterium]
MVLLGDTVRAGWWPSMVSGLLLAVLGVMVLADSPAQQPPHATSARCGRRPGRA